MVAGEFDDQPHMEKAMKQVMKLVSANCMGKEEGKRNLRACVIFTLTRKGNFDCVLVTWQKENDKSMKYCQLRMACEWNISLPHDIVIYEEDESFAWGLVNTKNTSTNVENEMEPSFDDL